MSDSWLRRSDLFCLLSFRARLRIAAWVSPTHPSPRDNVKTADVINSERVIGQRDRERTRQDFNGLMWWFDGGHYDSGARLELLLNSVTCYVLSPGEIHFPPSALCTYKHRSVRQLQINWSNVVDNIVIAYEEAIPVYRWIGNKAWSILVPMIENIRIAISPSFMFAVIRIKLSSGLLADRVKPSGSK